MKKETTGMVTISRVQSSDRGSYVRIEIKDEVSGTVVTSVNMSFEQFGNAVTGLYGCEGELTVYDTTNVGKKREYKTEKIKVPKLMSSHDAGSYPLAIKLLKPLEVDGWKGCADDLFNSHRTSIVDDVRYQSVGYHRYVDVEDTE